MKNAEDHNLDTRASRIKVELVVQGHTIHGHSSILSAHSKYLASLIANAPNSLAPPESDFGFEFSSYAPAESDSEQQQSRKHVVLSDDIALGPLVTILRFIYTGVFDVSPMV